MVTIVTRAGKGSPLSHAEVDANFTNLNSGKVETAGFDAAVAATPAVTANTAKVTNATHTGEVTGSVALTIAANAVTNAKRAQLATARIRGRVTFARNATQTVKNSAIRAKVNLIIAGYESGVVLNNANIQIIGLPV